MTEVKRYCDIGMRGAFGDKIWIIIDGKLETSRGMSLHKKTWPEEEKTCPSGRCELDTLRCSVFIPEGCTVTLNEIKSIIKDKTHRDFEYFLFDRKE